MCSTDYDLAEPYSEKIVTAKKDHECTECHRIIKTGEKYQYIWGVWARKTNTFKSCRHCIIPQEWLRAECDGWLLGGLEGEIEEHFWDYRKMFLARMLVGIRRKWKKFKSNE